MSQYRDSFVLVEEERGRRMKKEVRIWMKRGEEKC